MESHTTPLRSPPLLGKLRGPKRGPPNFYKEIFEEKETNLLQIKTILVNQIQQKKETNTFSKKNPIWGFPRPTGFLVPL